MSTLLEANTFIELEKLFEESVSCEYSAPQCANEAEWVFFCPTIGCTRQNLLCTAHKIETRGKIILAIKLDVQLVCDLCGVDVLSFPLDSMWRPL